MTAEIVTAKLTEDDARRLTQRIRLAAQKFTELRDQLLALVEEARTGGAHLALGFPSWTAYLSDVLSDEPLRLAREDRKELVGILASEGMPTRAIGTIVGADHATVVRDLAPTGASAPVERPPTVTSLDGRERPAAMPKRKDQAIELPDPPNAEDSIAEADLVDDGLTTLLDAESDLTVETRYAARLYQLDDTDHAALDRHLRSMGALLAEFVAELRTRRIAFGDPYEVMADELANEYPDYRVAMPLKIDDAFRGLRGVVRNPEVIRARVKRTLKARTE